MQLKIHHYPPMTPRAETRVMVSRARLALQAQAIRHTPALDYFTAAFVGAMLGWIAAGAGLV